MESEQLADMAGLDRTTINALEHNKFNEIGIRKVQRVLPNLDDMQRFNRESR